MAAQLHYVVANIEYSRWSSHIQEWKNKIANDIEYQKQKQEDLLVLGCYELIIAYFESFNIPGIREPFKNNTFKSQFDQEQYENNHAMLPMIDCYVEMNGSEGYYESNCGFFDFVDLKDWIREMIRSVENEKYCKYVDICFSLYDHRGKENRIATIQQEVDEEDIPETEDNSCPCGNCVN